MVLTLQDTGSQGHYVARVIGSTSDTGGGFVVQRLENDEANKNVGTVRVTITSTGLYEIREDLPSYYVVVRVGEGLEALPVASRVALEIVVALDAGFPFDRKVVGVAPHPDAVGFWKEFEYLRSHVAVPAGEGALDKLHEDIPLEFPLGEFRKGVVARRGAVQTACHDRIASLKLKLGLMREKRQYHFPTYRLLETDIGMSVQEIINDFTMRMLNLSDAEKRQVLASLLSSSLLFPPKK